MPSTFTTHLNQNGASTTYSRLRRAGYVPFCVCFRHFVVIVQVEEENRVDCCSHSNYCEYLLTEAEIVVESLAVVHVVDEVDAVALRLDTFFRRQQQ